MKLELKLINKRSKKIGYLISFRGSRKYIIEGEKDYKVLGIYGTLSDVLKYWEDYDDYLIYGENHAS